MIYTEMTKKAMKLCFAAHKDQTDKSGVPYVFHPIHLAEQMESEEAVIIALLHDVVEDTAYTLADLAEMGFSRRITDALALLAHDESVPYLEYVSQVKENALARAVKLVDLKHNSDLSRLDEVSEEALLRMKQYEKAIALLAE